MPADLKAILKIEVPVIVQIASRIMPFEEIVRLTPGAIIELPRTAEEDLEVHINNHPVAMGSAVKVGENFGVRLTFVGDVKSRIAAMAGHSLSLNPDAADGSDLTDADAAAMADEILAGL